MRKDDGQHSFSLWTMQCGHLVPRYFISVLSVGYWVSFIFSWVSHNLLLDRRNSAPHFFVQNRLGGVTGEARFMETDYENQ